MTAFCVHSTQLSEAACRLDPISPSLNEFQGRTSRHAEAGHGTAAARDLSDLAAHWGAVLPAFAAAGTGLSGALRAAAAGYQATDRAIAQTAVPE